MSSHVLTIVYQSLGRQQSVTASYCHNAYEDRGNRKACSPPETLCLVLWSRSGAADSFLWLPGNLWKAWKARAPWKKKKSDGSQLNYSLQAPHHPSSEAERLYNLLCASKQCQKQNKIIDSGQCNIYQECF